MNTSKELSPSLHDDYSKVLGPRIPFGRSQIYNLYVYTLLFSIHSAVHSVGEQHEVETRRQKYI